MHLFFLILANCVIFAARLHRNYTNTLKQRLPTQPPSFVLLILSATPLPTFNFLLSYTALVQETKFSTPLLTKRVTT